MAEQHNYGIGILASGSGTTLDSLGHSIVANKLPLEITSVICDRPGAGVFDVVRCLNKTYGWDIRSMLVSREDYPGGPRKEKWHLTDQQSQMMAAEFANTKPIVIAQLGFLSLTRGELFEEYGSLPSHDAIEQTTLVNTHPGFLWQTKGLHGRNVHKKVVADGSDKTAQTLHVVTDEYDEGEEIAVNEVAVLPSFTWKDVEAEVQRVEKAFIGRDITAFAMARDSYLRAA